MVGVILLQEPLRRHFGLAVGIHGVQRVVLMPKGLISLVCCVEHMSVNTLWVCNVTVHRMSLRRSPARECQKEEGRGAGDSRDLKNVPEKPERSPGSQMQHHSARTLKE